MAEDAGVDPFAVFAASLGELASGGGCTDPFAMPEVSADGDLLVAHNGQAFPSPAPTYLRIAIATSSSQSRSRSASKSRQSMPSSTARMRSIMALSTPS